VVGSGRVKEQDRGDFPRFSRLIRVPRTEKLVIKDVGPFKGKNTFEFESNVNLVVGSSDVCEILLNCLRSCYTNVFPPVGRGAFPVDEKIYVRGFPVDGKIEKSICSEVAATKGLVRDNRPVYDNERGVRFFDGVCEKGWKRLFQYIDKKTPFTSEVLRLAEVIVPGETTREEECYLVERPFVPFKELEEDPEYELNDEYDYETIIIDYLKKSEFQCIVSVSEVPKEFKDVNIVNLD